MKISEIIEKLNEIQNYITSEKIQLAWSEINKLKEGLQNQKDEAGDYMDGLIKQLK